MAFHCKHCGTIFSMGPGRPRCPTCLRMTTLVEVADPPPPPRGERPEGSPAPGRGAQESPELGSPAGTVSPPAEGLPRPPWPLWVGAAVLGATTIAVFATRFGDLAEGEGLGAAAAYAALGGAGFALVIRGFIKWRPWR